MTRALLHKLPILPLLIQRSPERVLSFSRAFALRQSSQKELANTGLQKAWQHTSPSIVGISSEKCNKMAGLFLVGILSAAGMAMITYGSSNKEKYWKRTGERDATGCPVIEELLPEEVSEKIAGIRKEKPAMILLPGVGVTHGSVAISVDNNSSGIVQSNVDELKKMLGGYTSCLGTLFPAGPNNIITLSWGNALNAQMKAYDPHAHRANASQLLRTLSPVLKDDAAHPLVIIGFSQGGSSIFPLKAILQEELSGTAIRPAVVLISIAPSKQMHHDSTPHIGKSIPHITIISPDDLVADKPTVSLIQALTDRQVYIEAHSEDSVTIYVKNRTSCIDKEEDTHSLKSYLGCQLSRGVIESILKEVSSPDPDVTKRSAMAIVNKVAKEGNWEVISDHALRIQGQKEVGRGR